jgi:hypothetical protein
MQTNSQCADDKIVLSSAVLEHVKELSVAALKVYLYLGSYGPDRPIRAGINVIGNAVSLQRRSTIDALKALVKRELISCNRGRGSQPNEYHLRFSGSPGAPNPETTATVEIATVPRPPTDLPASTVPPQREIPLQELISRCYRPIDAREFRDLKAWFPDEAILRGKLESLKSRGDGVAPEMDLGFLVRLLEYLD